MDEQNIELSEAYHEYFNLICKYIAAKLSCDTYIAQDIASDTFYTLQIKWDTITPHTSAVIVTWLYKAADNKIKDFRKKMARTPTFFDWNSPEVQTAIGEIDKKLVQINDEHDYKLLLNHIQRSLSKNEWAFFVSIYVDKRSPDEVMQQFGINSGTLYVRRGRLGKRVQKIILKYFDEKC